MRGDPKDHTGPTVFATHSTHKLLAALSQASFLHIRDGRGAIPHARFNESFMMHASTSPLYTIIASNDITSAMMDGLGGTDADQRVHRGGGCVPPDDGPPARALRQGKRDWFFNTWNATDVTVLGGRKRVPFHEAPADVLAQRSGRVGDASRRRLARFRHVARRLLHARSDQGVDRHARRRSRPASSRNPAFRRRWSPRISTGTAFRSRRRPTSRCCSCSRSASRRASGARSSRRCSTSSVTTTRMCRSSRSLPKLTTANPERYGKMGLHDLADEMFDQLKSAKQTKWLAEAFSTLADGAHDAGGRLPRTRARQHRTRGARRHGRTACSQPASCRIRPAFRC